VNGDLSRGAPTVGPPSACNRQTLALSTRNRALTALANNAPAHTRPAVQFRHSQIALTR
jgi:hypothetical protein